ncbi:hypothetical protein J4Q44_G00140320 [Coregonus suidteri]|uniref:Uncharacterized protein n=1 Tax=Coregonus suidteri TaxID=861788 RepID=A0AAN8LTD7_9TELE
MLSAAVCAELSDGFLARRDPAFVKLTSESDFTFRSKLGEFTQQMHSLWQENNSAGRVKASHLMVFRFMSAQRRMNATRGNTDCQTKAKEKYIASL